MPTSCAECLNVGLWNVFECHLDDVEQGKRPDCPLIEIPDKHGRLIDADALNDLINKSYPMTDRVDVHNGYAICQIMIKGLPTVIEADECKVCANADNEYCFACDNGNQFKPINQAEEGES